MTALPNPFDPAACPQVADEAAALPVNTSGPVDAAANSPGDRSSSLPSGESDPSVTPDLASGEYRFVLDEVAFMEAIEPLPMFLQAPLDVIELLAGHM